MSLGAARTAQLAGWWGRSPVMPTDMLYLAVGYGNNSYVAVGTGTAPTATTIGAISYDALNWTAITMPSAFWRAVTWGNDRWVAIGDGTSAAYSLDGITWTASTLPTSLGWSSVAYGGGVFVAVGRTSGGFSTTDYATSTDGITWTARTFNTGDWSDIVYGNSEFVAISSNGQSQVSATGTGSWSSGTLPSGATGWAAVAYGAGRYVAVTGSTSITTEAAWSTDGLTWTSSGGIFTSATTWSNIEFGAGLFVAIGTNSNELMYSTNGATWTAGTMPKTAFWQGIAYGPGPYKGFVAVGYVFASPAGVAAFSRNGIAWY